jgi:hypothetical protein
MGGNDFAAAHRSAAQIRTEAGLEPGGRRGARQAQLEKHLVPDETEQTFAGGGHHHGAGNFHLKKVLTGSGQNENNQKILIADCRLPIGA